MDTATAASYIRQNFERDDRLAVVFISKSAGPPVQRIAAAERLVTDSFLNFMEQMNNRRFEVYLSMNTLRADAQQRRKQDIGEIRHVYLDFDVNATEAVRAMRQRGDVPTPNHLIESSPGRFQAIWRVEGFELSQAEQLMRGMVREFGADPAAVDASRVMRLPGFYNHKYGSPVPVRVETLSDEVYRPVQFPAFAATKAYGEAHGSAERRSSRSPGEGLTQSERDWIHVKRQLAMGADRGEVQAALAAERSDKPNPQYYAELTVTKAQRAVEQERQGRGLGMGR